MRKRHSRAKAGSTEQKIKEELAKGKHSKRLNSPKKTPAKVRKQFVLLCHPCRAASFAMIQPTIEFDRKISLDTGEQVMIYSEYPEVQTYHAYFNKDSIPASVDGRRKKRLTATEQKSDSVWSIARSA